MKVVAETTREKCIRRWESYEKKVRPKISRSPMFNRFQPSFQFFICRLEKSDVIKLRTINDPSWKPLDPNYEFSGLITETLDLIKRDKLKLKTVNFDHEYNNDFEGITLFQNTSTGNLTILEGNHRIVWLFNKFNEELFAKLGEVILIKGSEYPFAW